MVDGVTLGTPLAVLVRNKDQQSKDYSEMEVAYRPSHAGAPPHPAGIVSACLGGGRGGCHEDAQVNTSVFTY